MMHRLYTRRSEYQDCIDLAPLMRKADQDECFAAGELNPVRALTRGFDYSTVCVTILTYTDNVVAMFGAGPGGTVWLLGSDELMNYRRQFLRESAHWWKYLHRGYPVLQNFVDARNTTHIRWLKYCGCDFSSVTYACGPKAMPFYHFTHYNRD